jgi:hypothetical protein
VSIFFSRSAPSLEILVQRVSMVFCVHLGKEVLKSFNPTTSGQVAGEGVPRILNILKIWSIYESPQNRHFLCAISKKMHPTDHTSTVG